MPYEEEDGEAHESCFLSVQWASSTYCRVLRKRSSAYGLARTGSLHLVELVQLACIITADVLEYF